MINYLSRFIKDLSTVAAELRQLDKIGVPWSWTDIHQHTFEKLKNMIISTPTLKYFDPSVPIQISCEASDYGLGTVLL